MRVRWPFFTERGVGEVLGEGAVGDFGGDEEVEDDRLVGAIEGDENPISLIGANDGVGVLFCLDCSSTSVEQRGGRARCRGRNI